MVIPVSPFQADVKGLGILRVVQHGNNFVAEVPRRHWRAEASHEFFGLDANGARIGVGARVTDAGPADDMSGALCCQLLFCVLQADTQMFG